MDYLIKDANTEAFQIFGHPASDRGTSAVNSCCHRLLWLKSSICLLALNTIWGYFGTVPNRIVLYYGLAWQREKRPGFATHGVYFFVTFQQVTEASLHHSSHGCKTRMRTSIFLLTLWVGYTCQIKKSNVKSAFQIVGHHVKLLSPVRRTGLNRICVL